MFNIPILGGIPVGESVVVTWIIMAALTILSIVLVRNLKVENPGRKQLVLESFIGFLNDFFTDILGEEGKRYIPYLDCAVMTCFKVCPHILKYVLPKCQSEIRKHIEGKEGE